MTFGKRTLFFQIWWVSVFSETASLFANRAQVNLNPILFLPGFLPLSLCFSSVPSSHMLKTLSVAWQQCYGSCNVWWCVAFGNQREKAWWQKSAFPIWFCFMALFFGFQQITNAPTTFFPAPTNVHAEVVTTMVKWKMMDILSDGEHLTRKRTQMGHYQWEPWTFLFMFTRDHRTSTRAKHI